MSNLKVCVYTVNSGNPMKDDFVEPKPENLNLEYDYKIFTDNTEKIKAEVYQVIPIDSSKGFEDVYKAVSVIADSKDKMVAINHLIAQKIRVMPHLFKELQGYDLTVWHDARFEITDMDKLMEGCFEPRFPLHIYQHPERDCIFDELEEWNRIDKGFYVTNKRTLEYYNDVGFPKNYGLMAGTIQIRDHRCPVTIAFLKLLWEHILNYSFVDQLSLPDVLWITEIPFRILGVIRDKDFDKTFIQRRHNWKQTWNEYSVEKNESISGFMDRGDLIWLYTTAKKMRNIAELGSWMGRGTYALLKGCQGNVHAIDHFMGSSGERSSTHKEVRTKDIHEIFMSNVGHLTNLNVMKLNTLDAAGRLQDKGCKFDMVFVDAGHSYEEVKADIRAWLPLTTKLICGHDYKHPPVKRAVTEILGEHKSYGKQIWYKEL